MKKVLYLQSWMSICIFVLTILFLCTSFNLYIIPDSDKFDKYSSPIENGEKYELNEFCEIMEDYEADQGKQSGDIIDWDGELLEMHGVGAKDDYNIFGFVLDLIERFLSNLRFDVSALVASPIKNLIVYLLCILLEVSAIIAFVTGLIKSISALIKVISKQKKDVTINFDTKGMLCFVAPLFVWLGIVIFKFYNSFALKDIFEVENKITINYTSGISYLIMCVAVIAVYYLGYGIISKVVKEEILLSKKKKADN